VLLTQQFSVDPSSALLEVIPDKTDGRGHGESSRALTCTDGRPHVRGGPLDDGRAFNRL
jgi:hypothetical protein